MTETIIYERLPQPTSGTKPNKPVSIRLTVRDIAILEALYGARFLTTPQIQKLFWPGTGGTQGPMKACQRRLRKLSESNLIRQIEQPVRRSEATKPYLYALATKGAEVLAGELGLALSEVEYKPAAMEDNYPFLDHLIATTDFRIAALQSSEQNDLTLSEWLDEKDLRSTEMKDYVLLDTPHGTKIRVAVVPDAYFAVSKGSKSMSFFVEIDRGTVTIRAKWNRGWTRKILTYLAYFDSDAYQKRFGTKRVRLLTVTTTKKRLEHMLAATEDVEGSDNGLFWFATQEDATDPTKLLSERIWHVAGAKGQFILMG